MVLTNNQIQALRTFIRKKGVVFIDLQDELIDHMSSGIEEQMSEDASVKFEDALAKEYKKFGIFGFDDILSEKAKAIELKGVKMFFLDVLNYLKLPKLVLSIASFYLMYFVIDNYPSAKLYAFSIITLMSVVIPYRSLYWKFKFKKSEKKYISILKYMMMLQLCSSVTGLWFYSFIIGQDALLEYIAKTSPYLLASIGIVVVMAFFIQSNLISNLKNKLEYN